MDKMKRVIVFICVLAVVLIGLCVVISALQLHLQTDIYIFANIAECNKLLHTDSGSFIEYSDTALDNNLNNLQYAEYFAGKYSCDEYTFEIFAYVFEEPMSAKTYFENATGKNAGDLGENYSMVSGIIESHIVVFKENNAYAVYCPSNSLSDVSQILADHFQLKIK